MYVHVWIYEQETVHLLANVELLLIGLVNPDGRRHLETSKDWCVGQCVAVRCSGLQRVVACCTVCCSGTHVYG